MNRGSGSKTTYQVPIDCDVVGLVVYVLVQVGPWNICIQPLRRCCLVFRIFRRLESLDLVFIKINCNIEPASATIATLATLQRASATPASATIATLATLQPASATFATLHSSKVLLHSHRSLHNWNFGRGSSPRYLLHSEYSTVPKVKALKLNPVVWTSVSNFKSIRLLELPA